MPKQDSFLDGQEPRKLEDIISRETALSSNPALSDFLNLEVVIVSCYFKPGKFGEYAVLTLCTPDNQTKFQANTGSAPVMRQLRALKEVDAFPITAKVANVKGTRQIILD